MRSTKKLTVAGLIIATACAASGPKPLAPTVPSAVQAKGPDLRLVLNIPASRLDVFERGVRTHSYDVSAGAREFSTPAGKYRISLITWNPWWHPPDSKWARDEKPTPPGPDNPMGRVKLNFAPLLYIHGTPFEEDLGAPASHGCIRMSNRDLLELTRIVHRYRTPRVRKDLLADLEKNPTMTRTFHVKPVPFEVAYRLVEVRDGNLVIYPDVYRSAGSDLRAEIVTVLGQQGIKITPALEERVAAISKKRNATRLTVALDSLLTEPMGD